MPVLDRRRPTQRRTERRVVDDDDAGPSELPPYEPLACPLSNEAKRAIADLSNSRDVHRYQNHIKAALGNLTPAVAEINDRLRERNESLRNMAAKRAESDDPQEKSQREVDVEAHVAAVLDDKVPRLTAEAEAALRDLIDRQVALDDEKDAFAETVEYFQGLPAQGPSRPLRRRRQQDDDELGENGQGDAAEEEDDDEPPPPPEHTVIDTLRQHKADKSREYDKLNAYQRYALNNHYAHFKKLWHDAAHGDTGPPLPNAKRWFDDAGNPVMPRTARDSRNVKNEAGGAGEDDDEDEDLVIAGEVREYRCPLSMAEFKEPYSNRVCSHTYEKQWIEDMLRKAPNRRAQCPVAGCSMELDLEDLYFDEVILRKMKRAQESQRLAEEEASSSDGNGDGDDDEPREVKPRGWSKGGKRKVEEIDDE